MAQEQAMIDAFITNVMTKIYESKDLVRIRVCIERTTVARMTEMWREVIGIEPLPKQANQILFRANKFAAEHSKHESTAAAFVPALAILLVSWNKYLHDLRAAMAQLPIGHLQPTTAAAAAPQPPN